MFLYPYEFWRTQFSISKIQGLKNTDFVFKPNFYITKMAQIVYNMCWIFITHICISKILKELIFVEFMCILWNLF